jgi:ABC-2 type transport system permease protein
MNKTAIYVLWLREMKKFFRAKSRIFGTLAMPLFFLVFLGFGFKNMPLTGFSEDVSYINFLIPGIIGMNMLFSSMFAGISVLWDREFGFLKEIMVAPVDRVSIVIGRILGGITTGLIQGTLILLISMLFGFKLTLLTFLIGMVFMIFIAATFIGLGLVIASRMRDMQGFNIIMNFVIFPLFFLSGALTPLNNMPAAVRVISHLDPLTYGVDGMRGVFLGVSSLPVILDFAVLVGCAMIMVFLGAYLFDRTESV